MVDNGRCMAFGVQIPSVCFSSTCSALFRCSASLFLLLFLSHRPLPLYFFYPSTLPSLLLLFHPLSLTLSLFLNASYGKVHALSVRCSIYSRPLAAGTVLQKVSLPVQPNSFPLFFFLAPLCQFFFLWFLSFSFNSVLRSLLLSSSACFSFSLCMSSAQG